MSNDQDIIFLSFKFHNDSFETHSQIVIWLHEYITIFSHGNSWFCSESITRVATHLRSRKSMPVGILFCPHHFLGISLLNGKKDNVLAHWPFPVHEPTHAYTLISSDVNPSTSPGLSWLSMEYWRTATLSSENTLAVCLLFFCVLVQTCREYVSVTPCVFCHINNAVTCSSYLHSMIVLHPHSCFQAILYGFDSQWWIFWAFLHIPILLVTIQHPPCTIVRCMTFQTIKWYRLKFNDNKLRTYASKEDESWSIV